MKKSAVLFIGLAVIILSLLFVWLKPDHRQAPEADAPQAFAFTIRAGQKVSGPDIMQVSQGQQVRIIVNADRADQLHLHGYDLQVEIEPEQSEMLAFTADRAGRFEIELHKAHAQLGVLQVQPAPQSEKPDNTDQ